MNVALFNKPKTHLPIGLDVGEAGLRLVQLQDDAAGTGAGTSASLSIHRSAVWTPDFAPERPPHDDAIEEHATRFVAQSGFAGRSAITSLCVPAIEAHALELPRADNVIEPQELLKAATWEIHRLTALDKTELQTAIWPLPETQRSQATYMGIAAPQAQVQQRLDLCTAARLECSKVDVAGCALANLIWRLRGHPPKQVWGILDLGDSHTRLTICVDDTPVIMRSLEMGGRSWTEQIAAALQVSEATAERNKREFGLGSDAKNQTAGGELSAMILGILRDDVQRMSLELERSYEYVLQCYPSHTPSALILVGGGAQLKGLDHYLAGKLGIDSLPVSRCASRETESLISGLRGHDSLEICALACGLSLQGAAHA
ncbi:MAG: pilus assembly protein PilM [Planctomycetes bacterium]|nr:pilus assembly protein PilM [Planctomycetota bacterium]